MVEWTAPETLREVEKPWLVMCSEKPRSRFSVLLQKVSPVMQVPLHHRLMTYVRRVETA
jgi:hypothetical protein